MTGDGCRMSDLGCRIIQSKSGSGKNPTHVPKSRRGVPVLLSIGLGLVRSKLVT